MKLFLISQDWNSNYDTFDAAVVAAPDEETARRMYPGSDPSHEWCAPEHVQVEHIGETTRDQGVILGSYNAG